MIRERCPPPRLAPLAGLAAAVFALAAPGAAHGGDRAILVDLRSQPEPDGGELAVALDELPEIDLRADPGIRAALAGAPPPGSREAGQAALDRAAAAYGKLDCERTAQKARRAARHLAAARASALAPRSSDAAADAEPAEGRENQPDHEAQAGSSPTPGEGEAEALTEALVRAHTYEFLCAEAEGDLGTLQRSARRLRNLGAPEPPEEIAEDAWERAPELDASAAIQTHGVAIRTAPEGAEVWIDHEPVDRGPLKALLQEGEVLVAAAEGGWAAAAHFGVEGPGQALELELQPVDDRWESLRAAVAAWREGRNVTPVEIANVLQRLESKILIVRREGELALWGRAPGARVAERIGTISDEKAARRTSDRVAERVVAWEPGPARGPDPDRPLLRERPEDREAGREDEDDGPSWWVYASIGAAVGLGAAFVIGNDLATDRQRIELTWP